LATVGDILIGAREIFPDNPASFIAPPDPTPWFFFILGSDGILPPGTYYIVFTYYNSSGETTQSVEKSFLISTLGTHIQVNFTLPTGATGIRAYMGTTSGTYTQYFQSTTAPLYITGLGGVASTPPTNNTCYNPDSDGNVVGVSTVYRWMNDALSKAALAAGGINDMTGVASVVGQGRYTLLNRWVKFTNMWYDGWLMGFLDNGNFYYHNSETGISWMATMQQVTTRNVFEVSPQANRTSGTAQVSSNVGIADSIINFQNLSGWVLPLGLALLGTPPQCEVISYDLLNASSLGSCVRGLGGTIPQSWVSGTPITELNIRLHGSRMPVYYPVGSSMATLDIPYNWEENIKDYMVGMYREAEQEFAEADKKKQQFKAWTLELARQNRQMMGPVQVGLSQGREAWGGSIGGGWFIQ
jgi:hypothetical protein